MSTSISMHNVTALTIERQENILGKGVIDLIIKTDDGITNIVLYCPDPDTTWEIIEE